MAIVPCMGVVSARGGPFGRVLDMV